jgi:UDP:flavonoid glycosyltransferase YjiC (YdhE family)
LRDVSRAHSRLVPEGIGFGQAPVWLPRLANVPRLGNYANVLVSAGWLDPAGLASLILAWRQAIAEARPDVVVCDHAPTALLALRARPELPVWAVGSSFELPPLGASFPTMSDAPQDEPRAAAYDAVVLPEVNRALALLGEAPLGRLPDLFSGARIALVGLPELAHYTRAYGADVMWSGPLYEGDKGVEPNWPSGPGARIFAYLEPGHPAFEATVQALNRLQIRTIVHAKGLAPQAALRLAGRWVRFEPSPVKVDTAVAQSDGVISHASSGMVTAAALAGKPQLVLPNHAEQGMVARRLLALGAGVQVLPAELPMDMTQPLRKLLSEDLCSAAQALATRYSGKSAGQTADHLADQIAASLPRS